MKEENETIIKALNKYGRVPEQWELLNEIDNLQEEYKQTKLLKERYQLEKEVYKSRIDKAIEYIKNDWYELNTRDIEHCINFNKDIRIDLLNILNDKVTEYYVIDWS